MIRIATAFFLFAVCISGFSQAISVSGTVSNSKGKGIAGATVTLASKNLVVKSDANGAFKIAGDVAVMIPAPLLPLADKISVNNNVVVVSMTRPSTVKIELFDIHGSLLERTANRAVSAGEYRFDLSSSVTATTMMAVRVSAGSAQSTFRCLPFRNGNRIVSAPVSTSTAGITLSKIAATVDSLSVAAAGYTPKTVAVSSYQSSAVNVTLDTLSLAKFSFFVTSLKGLQTLSGSANGFGGDLRFGKTGQGAGLLGADSICQCLAEKSMPGSKAKQWRAFLSVAKGPNGQKVNAIDRVGNGPWYDRVGRVVALAKADLAHSRPLTIDEDIKDDLPNENGIPNHQPDLALPQVDNHLTITGSDTTGKLYDTTATCEDWTSTTTTKSKPRSGVSWPRTGFGGFGKVASTAFGGGGFGSMNSWLSIWSLPGCQAGIDLEEKTGAGTPGAVIIGSGGGYGGFYCFALTP